MKEPTTKSLAQLLSEPVTDNEEFICTTCGHSQKDRFQRCPKCNKWAEYPTLGDWGKQLPVGIEVGDKLVKSFDLMPLDFKKEREINRQWGAARRSTLTISDYIGTILSNTVTQIGTQDITKFKHEKRLLIFNQMYQADVFYVYAYLRLLSLGHEMRMTEMQCGSCGFKFPFSADLRSLEVVVIGSPSELISDIELRDGFDLNGQNRTKLKVKPPLWSMMGANFPMAGNEAELFAAMMANCVIAIDGMPDGTVLTTREFDQFTKYDVEICQNVLNSVLAGPRWEIEGTCPKCEASFYDLVDWSYDGFFALSSRSPRLMKRSRRSSR